MHGFNPNAILRQKMVVNCLHVSVHCNFYSIVLYYEVNASLVGWNNSASAMTVTTLM